MRFQLVVMAAGVIAAVIALLFSKYVRTVTKESFVRPRDRCEIEIADGNVSVKRSEPSENSES
jgi:hypothetical protein